MFGDSAHCLYEEEREKLIRDFFKKKSLRDSILKSQKTFYENLAHATVSLVKNDEDTLSNEFTSHKVEIESESFIERETITVKASERSHNQCNAAKSFITQAIVKMKKNCLLEYVEALKSAEKAESCISEAYKEIASLQSFVVRLNEAISRLLRNHEFKTCELGAEKLFLDKLCRRLQERVRVEARQDFEKMKFLAKVCEKRKISLKKSESRATNVLKLSKMCSKYERPTYQLDLELNNDVPEATTDIFLRKIAIVEQECQELKALAKAYREESLNLHEKIKLKTQDQQFAENLVLLNIQSSPSVGKISQISHQIPQLQYMKFFRKFRQQNL